MRLQENGEVWVSWFVGYFIRIISSVGYHPKYSERWGVCVESVPILQVVSLKIIISNLNLFRLII